MNITIDTNGIDFKDIVEDTISGFVGKVVGFSTWDHGIVNASVQPNTIDNILPSNEWFNVKDLKIIQKNSNVKIT